MKKAALILALLMITPASFAYIEEFTTSDNKTLQGTGYSQSTLEIIDTARMIKQGVERDYVPYYSRQYYSKTPVRKWYQVAKRYFDPAASEEVFGVRELHYQNTWFSFSPSYYEKETPNDRYQRLYDRDIKRLEVAGKTVKGSKGIEPAVDDKPAGPEYKDGFIMEDL